MEWSRAPRSRFARLFAFMSADEIPDGVRQLIAERIDSIPELEAILLLREFRARKWTAGEAGDRLYLSQIDAAHVLAILEQRGFIVADGDGYRYSPGSSELERTIDDLVTAYSQHLVVVTELVHIKPSARHFVHAVPFRGRK
ncbi:MAG TPA: hypothetical protein VHC69_18580 [Polyangiaceae bacterium]|nr:hypothetical protein [Polyangiaceae bacterium]